MDDIKKFLDKHKDLMEALADSILCPCCKKAKRSPFFNLGEAYNWAEGCMECSTKLKGK